MASRRNAVKRREFVKSPGLNPKLREFVQDVHAHIDWGTTSSTTSTTTTTTTTTTTSTTSTTTTTA